MIEVNPDHMVTLRQSRLGKKAGRRARVGKWAAAGVRCHGAHKMSFE